MSEVTGRFRLVEIQKTTLVWLDSNINESERCFQHWIRQFRMVTNCLKIFTDTNRCATFLTEIQDQKILLIVSNTIGQSFVPLVHENSRLESIYLFCTNEEMNTQWTQSWRKVREVFHDIKSICSFLKRDMKCYEQQDIHEEPISIVPLTNSSTTNFDQIDESFIYTQVLKEVLLNMDYDESALKELTEFCSDVNKDDLNELKIIKEFENDYDLHSPIWWYTRECFTYRMLNRALRTQDFDVVITMGVFMRDLHRQIEQLHTGSSGEQSFIVYRGQGMLDEDFQRIQTSRNGLISFNSFLSTSSNRSTSLDFASRARNTFDIVGILFVMKIDPTNTTTPFASVANFGYYDNSEREILFSMHTIFRICEVKQIDDRLWQVELEIMADNDQQLQALIQHIRYEIRGITERHRLGNLMIYLKQYHSAEKFYKTLAIEEKFFPSLHFRLADIYHNIGVVSKNINDYKSALCYFQRAVEIGQHNNFPENNPRFLFWKDNIDSIQKKLSLI